MHEFEINQKQLAKELDITSSAMSGIVLGKTAPTFKHLLYISEKYGVSLNFLMRDIGDMKLPTQEQIDELKKKKKLRKDLLDDLVERIEKIEELVFKKSGD